MSNDTYIHIEEAVFYIVAILFLLFYYGILIILVPFGFFYLWWEMMKPKNSSELMGTIFFGLIIEVPILFIQLTYLYPSVENLIWKLLMIG